MTNLSSFPMSSRQLPPEVIWLEPEQIEQAKLMGSAASEEQQWQSYLNALALLSFEQWLSDRLPEHAINRLAQTPPNSSIRSCYLEVNGFKFCLIAVEHVLDESVQIPQALVEHPELAAHFYVVHEVSEEQALVMVRGFLRFDELMNYRARYRVQSDFYQLPLSLLDAEPNHLLFYCRSLQPAAIPLPVRAASDPSLVTLTQTTTKLIQWLQDAFDQNWQTIDQLINPEAYFALTTRSTESGAKRGKLINLGVQLGQQGVALLVNVTSEAEGKLGVLVQLHPTGEARYLIPDLKLSLRSPTGKTLQEVTSRSQDNYIQLKPVKGRPGTRFSVVIHLDGETIEENFEL
ncbi:DUF1822 family protein [Phormidesmis sp. 146-33]